MQQMIFLQILLLAQHVSGSNHLYNTLKLLMMGIVVPETCWTSNKICNKNHLLHLVSILCPHLFPSSLYFLQENFKFIFPSTRRSPKGYVVVWLSARKNIHAILGLLISSQSGYANCTTYVSPRLSYLRMSQLDSHINLMSSIKSFYLSN